LFLHFPACGDGACVIAAFILQAFCLKLVVELCFRLSGITYTSPMTLVDMEVVWAVNKQDGIVHAFKLFL
jgi:hypothetical protein